MTALRTVLFVVPLALGAVLASPRPAQAQGLGCPAFDRPVLKLEPQMAAIRRDFSKTVQQLQAMPDHATGPAGAEHGRILGLAQAVVGERWQVSTKVSRKFGAQGVCASLSVLTVTFGYHERNVFVAKELPQGTCIHREVMQHEMKHVAVDEALLKEFMPVLKRRLETVLSRQGSVRAPTQEQAVATLSKPVEAALKDLRQEFMKEREKRQAKVDTLEEYRRVSSSCNGELRNYLKPEKGRR